MNSKLKKSVQVISYFASKTESKRVNRIKLMKLLWLADRLHLRKYGRPVLKDSYCALPMGPVPTLTKEISYPTYYDDYLGTFLKQHELSVESINETDLSYLSKTDIEVIDAVWNEFGGYNQWDLVNISHEYPEWKEHERKIENSFTKDSYPMNFESFFSDPPSKDGIHAHFFESTDESLQVAKEAFLNSISIISMLDKA